MVVVCSKRRTVWERAHGEDRGRSFKISLCRRGSASIAAESGRQESSDKVQTATSQTTPRTSEKSNENYTKSIKNVAIIFTKSLWDVEVGQNRLWTVFGTILWTPKVRPGRSKSGFGMPRGCQKHLENVSGCAKDVQKRVWRAPETRLETICLGERRPRRSWIDFRKFSRPNFNVFLERSWVDFRLCFATAP